jgi:hypothetical protein
MKKLIKSNRNITANVDGQGVLIVNIDCPPGPPRPGELIIGLAPILGISESDIPPPSSVLFGEWTYKFVGIMDQADFDVKQNEIKDYLFDLYDQGLARYVSFSFE